MSGHVYEAQKTNAGLGSVLNTDHGTQNNLSI